MNLLPTISNLSTHCILTTCPASQHNEGLTSWLAYM